MASDNNPYRSNPKTASGKDLAFTFRARTREGREVTDRVVAASLDDAWARLEQQGYRDIAMLDSDMTAIKLDDAASRRQLNFTAQEAMALRRDRSPVRNTIRLWFHQSNMLVW
ncbi:MAG: hypothetical protein JO002_07810, partial [Burkholderiaceae bacterium]|nr:hypothetical protein [Burkholderiaceae bacterium]